MLESLGGWLIPKFESVTSGSLVSNTTLLGPIKCFRNSFYCSHFQPFCFFTRVWDNPIVPIYSYLLLLIKKEQRWTKMNKN